MLHHRIFLPKKIDFDDISGETIPYQLSDLDITTEMEDENDRVLILWPVTIAHKIDEDSPLYDMNPRDILSSQFEILLTLEGVTEETGNTIQVRLRALQIKFAPPFCSLTLLYKELKGKVNIFTH